jgi:methionyl-tRNA synthetase
MGTCGETLREADDRLVLLRKEQEKYHEGSFEWADIQAKINQIVAENFLHYVNR